MNYWYLLRNAAIVGAIVPIFSVGVQAQLPQAQLPVYKNSLHLGADWLGMPNKVGPRFWGQYARHLYEDRLVAAASIGYLKIQNGYYLPGANQPLMGRPIKRVTLDLTASYDLLRNPRHAFRFGAGPSIWYCEDEKLGATYYTVHSDGTVTNVKAGWQPTNLVNFGFNVLTDYEYAFSRRTVVGVRFGVASIQHAGGLVGILGLNLGYRL